MADPKSPVDPGSLAARVADRYHLVLSGELSDWFDSGLWSETGGGEFRFAAGPESLLDEPGELLWPGLMPPDFLPLIGNGAGDWLCGRVGANDTISEVVHWYHGGGDWIPWGRGLAEAILFDAVRPRLPGPGRVHAVAAEDLRGRGSNHDDAWLRWALDRVGDPLAGHVWRALEHSESTLEASTALADSMVRHDACETAVRCELIHAANNNWDVIDQHCQAVTRRSPDLAWGWEWLGLAKQHQDDPTQAKALFARAAHCSAFTDQSIRFQTDFDADRDVKFSVARLRELGGPNQSTAYLETLLQTDVEAVRLDVHQYWMREAETQLADSDHAAAMESLIMAGWDLGTCPLSVYGPLLRSIAQAASASGQTARAAVAQLHSDCFAERYPNRD